MKKYFFGDYGGRFVPETLIPALEETAKAFNKYKNDKSFKDELNHELKYFVGRETPLYFAAKLSDKYNCSIFLKREDLCHTGAHKINNCIGQALLALKMNKKHLIAETGAGQHGVATATVAAHYGLQCTIFMGQEDIRRQAVNVERMQMLGAEVKSVKTGSQTLKDAINEAFRYWTFNVQNTHYLFGSVLGAYPFPLIVRHFQSIIGKEAKKQIMKQHGKKPDFVIACVGGGSNAIGIFSAFLNDPEIKLIGVEAGGKGQKTGDHAARFIKPAKGVLHGSYSYLLQQNGQVMPTHSIAPGLDYPMIGPEHALLHDQKQVTYDYASDKMALNGFKLLTAKEGIIPALESSHAIGYLEKIKSQIKDKTVIINLSGRGDKDLEMVRTYLKQER